MDPSLFLTCTTVPSPLQLSAGSAVRLLCACTALGARPPSSDAVHLVSEQLVGKASALLPVELHLLSSLLGGRIACAPVEGQLLPPSATTSSLDESVNAAATHLSEEEAPPLDGPVLPSDAAACSRYWADGVRLAFVQGLSRVPAQQLVSLASMRVGIPLSSQGGAEGPFGARWGAAVEAATLLKLSPAAAPTYGGMSAATRASLLGCLLRSRRRPSQAWLEGW